MTLLIDAGGWEARRALVTSGSDTPLSGLADAIADDLDVAMARPLYVPDEKALLTRAGGRCPRDGTSLEFDPFDRGHHRCSRCGDSFTGAPHEGLWRYWYHLWLAERAVHAAVLFALRGERRHADFAVAILDGYVARYPDYPNADNALGPSRVFFSTYLESIWLLQLCIALDALETSGGAPPALGARVRHVIVRPARDLIALYDERFSNRQVWNIAALMAAARLLGDTDEVQRLVEAPSGLTALIAHGCLADGSWYEGENYHMFAHRGLWYGVSIAERAGASIPPDATSRFDAGFLAPFLTMLPDATLPSRRDSQYAISLRQPRFAEHCELGIARLDEPRLSAIAAMLYSAPPGLPEGGNGRQRSSADVERNLPAMPLRRTDLGWRSLLFARPELPAAPPAAPRSAHLPAQGIAVFRRDDGRIYAALDYGESGGGHGHPDRLNLLLMHGTQRWLDDMGTGSYVDRSLHWYRSSLAHNAPLIDGRSQPRVAGRLCAYDERGAAGWVQARVDGLAQGVDVDRTLVVMPDYLIDEVHWRAGRDVILDLPNHAPVGAEEGSGWSAATLQGGSGLEDGFDFIEHAEVMTVAPGLTTTLEGERGSRGMRVELTCDSASELWRLTAPGAPAQGMHQFHLLRVRGASGRIRAVWNWAARGSLSVAFDETSISVRRGDGTSEAHSRHADGWTIDLEAGKARSSIVLGNTAAADHESVRGRKADVKSPPEFTSSITRGMERENVAPAPLPLPLAVRLGQQDYRRSECSWVEAGSPEADVHVSTLDGQLIVRVHMRKQTPMVFVTDGAENPLDNEPAEINGDGMQLYVVAGGVAGGWTIVPLQHSSRARGRAVRGWDGLSLRDAAWSATEDGYAMHVSIDLPPTAAGAMAQVGLLVNETAPGRARRRGQLVLGGAAGDWVYLRGDRIDPARLLAVLLPPRQLIL